jgi:hypothetical protein
LILYVLIAEAVYDHGVIGVYSSEQEARDVAEEIWPTTDGHHRFRIDMLRLGETNAGVFERYILESNVPPTYAVYGTDPTTERVPRPVNIEVNVRTNIDAPQA